MHLSVNRGDKPIAGATGQTYVLTILDESATLTCTVTAHSTENGTASATSAGVIVAMAARRNDRCGASSRRLSLGPQVLSTHQINPDRGYWRNTQREPGRWPSSSQ